MNRLLKLFAVSFFAMFLASCVFPTKFRAAIELHNDYTYTGTFDGDVVNPIVQGELVDDGEISPAIESELENNLKVALKDPNIKSAKYIGNGKFHIVYQVSRKLSDNTTQYFPVESSDNHFLSLTRKNNIVLIQFKHIDKNSKDDLTQLKLNDINWAFSLKTAGSVVDTNARHKPILGFGSYSWKLKTLDDPMPEIKIQLK